MASVTTKAPRSTKLRKSILTLLTIGALGAVGAYASTALLKDEVAVAGIEAHGGTLDLQMSHDDGASFSLGDLSNIQPKASWTGSKLITVSNKGSVAGKLVYNQTGTDSTVGQVGGNCYKLTIAGAESPWTKVVNFASPSVAVVDKDLGTIAAGETRKYTVSLEYSAACTIGSGLDSNGSVALADRHAGHAAASFKGTFTVNQI